MSDELDPQELELQNHIRKSEEIRAQMNYNEDIARYLGMSEKDHRTMQYHWGLKQDRRIKKFEDNLAELVASQVTSFGSLRLDLQAMVDANTKITQDGFDKLSGVMKTVETSRRWAKIVSGWATLVSTVVSAWAKFVVRVGEAFRKVIRWWLPIVSMSGLVIGIFQNDLAKNPYIAIVVHWAKERLK